MNKQYPLLEILRKSALGALLGLSLTSNSLPGQTSTITELKTLGGTAITGMALNNAGQVTGYSTIAGNTEQHAFLYDGGVTLDLGTLGGTFSQANTINSSGQIAGVSSTSSFQTRAFLYSNGTMANLDTLGGPSSVAFAINDTGQVVGQSATSAHLTHAFLYAAGQMKDLGTLGGSFSSASAINNAGQVTGDSSTGSLQTHAFLYSAGVMTDLGTLGGTYSTASGVNNLGQVAGESALKNFDTHAFLYSAGAIKDLGTLGGTYSTAYALNDSGQVIGDSSQTGDFVYHAFLFSGAAMKDLGTLGGNYSTASAINNLGQVVGDSATITGISHAFLFQNGAMIDLNSLLPPNSGWELSSAFCINDASQIVGFGYYQQQFRWYVLTLAASNRPPVAEAGADKTIECAGETAVVLDGSESGDPDGDALNFEWREGNVLLDVGQRITVNLPLGAHVITLKVTDPSNESSQDTIVVSVFDTTAPKITCPQVLSASAGDNCQATLPNVLTLVTVSDNCTPAEKIVLAQSPAAGTLVGIGVQVVTVTAMDDAGNTATCTTTFTVQDTTPPTITCPPGLIVSADDNGKAVLPSLLAGVTASDNCTPAGKLALSQIPTPGTVLGIGAHVVTVRAVDEAGNLASCSTTFTVQDTTPPVLTCPQSLSVSANATSQAAVPDIVSLTLVSDNGTAADMLVVVQNPTAGTLVEVGSHVITVIATDAAGNVSTCATTLTVADTTAPVINSVTASPNMLSQPNHQMVPVAVYVSATDNCDPAPVCRIVSVSSDEPVTGPGDNTTPDWIITGNLTVDLRAEHFSKSTGRAYTITVDSTDASGNSSRRTVIVNVTKQKNKP